MNETLRTALALLCAASLSLACATAVPHQEEGEGEAGESVPLAEPKAEPKAVDPSAPGPPRTTTETALAERQSWSRLVKSGREHLKRKELAQAEDRFTRAFDLTREMRPGDPRTKASIHNLERLASAYRESGDSSSFARVMELLVYISGEEPSSRDPELARLLQDLAATRLKQDRPTDARDALLLALSILEESGADDATLVAVHAQLALAHLEAENLQAAEAEVDRATEIALAAEDEKGPLYTRTLVSRSKVELARGNPVAAAAAMREAVELTEKRFGAETQATAQIVRELALLEHEVGLEREAEASFDRVIAIWDALPDENYQRAQSRNELAWFLVETGQPEHAEAPARSAFGMLEEQGVGGQPLAAVADTLATALRDQGKYGEAEPLYQEALAEGSKADDLAGWDVGEIADRYAEMLDRMGRSQDADELRARFSEEPAPSDTGSEGGL